MNEIVFKSVVWKKGDDCSIPKIPFGSRCESNPDPLAKVSQNITGGRGLAKMSRDKWHQISHRGGGLICALKIFPIIWMAPKSKITKLL